MSIGCGGNKRNVRHLLPGDVLRQLQMHGSRPLLLRDPEGLAHDRRDRCSADDLARHFGQWRHARDHVDNLKPGLFAGQNPLLTSNQNHRHGAEKRIGRSRGEIQRPRSQRADTDAGLARQPPVGRRHKRCSLLVPRDDECDLRAVQRLDHVQVFFTGNSENSLDSLILQRCD